MTSSKHFYTTLESARGLAALSVALFHCYCSQVVDGQKDMHAKTMWDCATASVCAFRAILIPFNGGAAVSFFFVLSGFVLALSLMRDRTTGIRQPVFFAERRFLRIYPALAVNLLITAAVALAVSYIPIPGPKLANVAPSLPALVDNLLLQSFRANGATWSLQVELAVVPFIFLAFCIMRRGGVVAALIIVCASLFLWRNPWALPGFLPQWAFNQITGPFLNMFMMGMAAAYMPRIPATRVQAMIALALGVAALMCARLVFGFNTFHTYLVEGPASALIILALINSQPTGVHRVLDLPQMRYLGRVSYSFYLYHTTALVLTAPIVLLAFGAESDAPWSKGTVAALISVPLAIAMAQLSYACVERPFAKRALLSERLLKPRQWMAAQLENR